MTFQNRSATDSPGWHQRAVCENMCVRDGGRNKKKIRQKSAGTNSRHHYAAAADNFTTHRTIIKTAGRSNLRELLMCGPALALLRASRSEKTWRALKNPLIRPLKARARN